MHEALIERIQNEGPTMRLEAEIARAVGDWNEGDLEQFEQGLRQPRQYLKSLPIAMTALRKIDDVDVEVEFRFLPQGNEVKVTTTSGEYTSRNNHIASAVIIVALQLMRDEHNGPR